MLGPRRRRGSTRTLPVRSWLGGRGGDAPFDGAVVALCNGPTIDLGCGPGRLVARLLRCGVPALGVDQSLTAVGLARRSGALVLHRDIFEPLPATGRWHTVLLADGNVGLGGDPAPMLARAAELLRRGGRCVAEFDPGTTGVRRQWARLESAVRCRAVVSLGNGRVDSIASLAKQAGLVPVGIHPAGLRVVASLAAI